ncbi:unnamed protein product, partial [Mesorhabditis belari]|uniref:HD/PDEase domain-containing protein n=1 Tax=Mesorhabditis belari TaxID=2138241 RepID=A0AAF3ER43_9BILA
MISSIRLVFNFNRAFSQSAQRMGPRLQHASQENVAWPLPEVEKPVRWISCVVHDSIPLFHPLEHLVDSAEFQRLRRLKQVGMANYVYPSAEHSRFTHSLGCYHLAFEFVSALRESDPSLSITSEDMLCVSIAALCHDIGHGPFSHMFDNELLKEKNPKSTWTHEMGSGKLIGRLFSKKSIREAFLPFLGSGAHFERNIQFIKELIHPTQKVDKKGKWILEGRDSNKSYLYDIVSNEEDGHDVDKYDYLLRDALLCHVDITFGQASLRRLRSNMRVLMDEKKGYRRIAYAKKVHNNLQSVGDSRQLMHRVVYQHYTCRAIERMVIRALLLADEHLTFTGSDGKRFKLSETINDMSAFLKTDDAVIQMIENHPSTSAEMVEARQILEKIHLRDIPKLVESEDFSPQQTPRIWIAEESIELHSESFKWVIRSALEEALAEELPGVKFEILLRNLNRGLDGKRHPAGEVLLFDTKKPKEQLVACRVQPEQMAMAAPRDPTIMSVAVFADPYLTKEDKAAIHQVFARVCCDFGLRSPNTSGHSSPSIIDEY